MTVVYLSVDYYVNLIQPLLAAGLPNNSVPEKIILQRFQLSPQL